MKFVAWRDLSDGYRQAVEGHSPWTRGSKNPEPITVANIDTAELDDSLKATVKAEEIAALAFVPLTAKGEVIGKFMTYYPAPHIFSEADINVAVTIARQLGFSLERMRAEEERRRCQGTVTQRKPTPHQEHAGDGSGRCFPNPPSGEPRRAADFPGAVGCPERSP
jgi:GAF domain-containing protein